MEYEMDMSQEKEKAALLNEGWHDFEIGRVVEATSKQNNPMFVITVMECDLLQEIEVYAISVKGKRWFLKQLLTAAGIAAGEDGVYHWDITTILNKIVQGRVEHEPDTWIDREGKQRTTVKSKIVEWKKSDRQPIPEKEKVPF